MGHPVPTSLHQPSQPWVQRLLQQQQNPHVQRTPSPRLQPNTLPHVPVGNSPRGSSEAHFSGSRQTLLLLPTSLGRQRHRAHSQWCSLCLATFMAPQAASSQAEAHFGALPQTEPQLRAARFWARGGKSATSSPWAESWEVPIPFIPEGAASWHPVLGEVSRGVSAQEVTMPG